MTTIAQQVPSQSKPWGRTRQIFRDETHEVWHASIWEGGYSSRHFHERKNNEFYVVSGTLVVKLFDDPHDALPREVITLGPGQRCVVEDNVWHLFESVTAVELIETYFSHLKGEDITRHDQGGLKAT